MSQFFAKLLQSLSDRLVRRELAQPAKWDDCEWSPKKAAEKRFKQKLVDHYMAMAKIQLDHSAREMMAKMQDGEILRATNDALHARAMKEYRKHYSDYQSRTGKP